MAAGGVAALVLYVNLYAGAGPAGQEAARLPAACPFAHRQAGARGQQPPQRHIPAKGERLKNPAGTLL